MTECVAILRGSARVQSPSLRRPARLPGIPVAAFPGTTRRTRARQSPLIASTLYGPLTGHKQTHGTSLSQRRNTSMGATSRGSAMSRWRPELPRETGDFTGGLACPGVV